MERHIYPLWISAWRDDAAIGSKTSRRDAPYECKRAGVVPRSIWFRGTPKYSIISRAHYRAPVFWLLFTGGGALNRAGRFGRDAMGSTPKTGILRSRGCRSWLFATAA